jgi:sulfur relay (sulfurtransferase) DsrF/TusC family protein
MIFRVYEHYDDNPGDYDVQECFICYDSMDDFQLKPISLKTQSYYNKKCKCDGWTHKKCLDTWYQTQHTCPMCRAVISKNDGKSNITITQHSKTLGARVLSSITNMAMYVLLFYISLEYYLYCATTKHLSRIRE